MPRTPASRRLDAAAVAAHVAALAANASQLEVRTKEDLASTSGPTSEPLDALVQRLVAGELAGLQIRFFADEQWWSDTLLRTGEAFRLARVREGD